MNLIELKNQIINKQIESVYYFTGSEWKIMNIYIHKIAEITNSKITYINSIKEAINDIKQTSLLTPKTIYVIQEDKDYILNDRLWDKINTINKNIIIFVYNTIDKRSKFYKQYKDNITTFDTLNDSVLHRYISNDTTLKNEYIVKLIEICEHDYGRITSEINKIKHFSDDHNKAFEILVNNGVIFTPPKDAVFELVDAILSRNATLSYYLYQNCKEIGEANLVILLNLFNSTRITYQVQSYQGNGDISQITGLKQGQIYACQKRLYKYTNDELVNLMKLIQQVESGIKQGTITDEISVDYILAQIFTRR